jgi:glycosyltransferase involved in cell wall biosynthesis
MLKTNEFLSNRIRLLHLCPGYYQRILYRNLFRALNYFHVINEIFTVSPKMREGDFENQFTVKVFAKRFTIIDRLLFFGKQREILNKITKDLNVSEYDIIHAHTLFSSGYSAYILNKKLGIPYIVAIRSTDINIFFKYMYHLRSLGNEIMRKSKKLIFFSDGSRDLVLKKYVKKNLKESFYEKSIVIPNGIDSYFLKNKYSLKEKLNSTQIKLIYIGEISANKNIETTIKAGKHLIQNGYNVRLTIVGEVINPKYRKVISKYDFINYYSKCSKEEVLRHLRESDIFVMPSLSETFGLVYAEAMSQGLPVIYSKYQGFDGQFDDGIVGYSVNSHNYKEISQKIIKTCNNYHQLSRNCLQLVDRFNWESVAQSYCKIYKQILLNS